MDEPLTPNVSPPPTQFSCKLPTYFIVGEWVTFWQISFVTQQVLCKSNDEWTRGQGGTWGELRPEKEESTDSGDLSEDKEEEEEAVGERSSWSSWTGGGEAKETKERDNCTWNVNLSQRYSNLKLQHVKWLWIFIIGPNAKRFPPTMSGPW